MDRRLALVGLVALLVVLAGCGQDATTSPATSADPSTATTTDPGTTTDDSTPTTTESSTTTSTTDAGPAVEPPPDPPTDRLGWEDGYWYNETLPITESDGLNESELDAVVSRAQARVEQLRGLEFNRTVPVEVVSRETYQSEYAGAGNETETLRTFDNAKFEMLFLVGEDTDSLAVQSSNQGSNVLGFYSPQDDRIVIVSESETPRVTETTLGHELVHALQFANFDADYNSTTRELHNARNGLIEGDARYLDNRYDGNCQLSWSCTTQGDSAGGGGDSQLHLGVYLMKYFPYSDGPGFVDHRYEMGGWEAVNEVYAEPPESAEQVITPRKYLEDSPTDVSLPDRSGDDWSRVTPEGQNRAPYGSVGQASITAMFAYPAYDTSMDGPPVVGPQSFLNVGADGTVNGTDPINYNVSYANGWDGDRLWVYDDAGDDNETAYTWRIAWDTGADATEFAEGYRQLLQYWGGERVDGADGVWRIPDGASGFADAFYLNVDGDTVTIVNAPTTGELSAVHSSAPSP